MSLDEKLKKVVIPIMDFEDTSLEEACDFLRLRAWELDTVDSDRSRKGVNIVIEGLPASLEELQATGPRIKTLQSKNVSLGDAFSLIAKATGMSVRVDEFAVVLAPTGTKSPKVFVDADSELGKNVYGKMKTIIVPSVRFDDTSVDEAVDFFRLRARELEINEPDPAKRGINVIVEHPKKEAQEILAGSAPRPGRRVRWLELRNIPLIEAFRYTCEMTGLQCRVGEDAIRIFDPAETKTAPVPRQ